jgi:quercetin dioxygenase-like cupin family protein
MDIDPAWPIARGRLQPAQGALHPTHEMQMTLTHQPDEGVFRAIHPEDVNWQPFPAFPPAARLAILIGDPTKPGPYLIRVRLPTGTKMMPHKHPEDRIYTVLSGVFYIGLGETFDESKLTAYGVGSVVVLPGGQPHFHWAKSGEYVTQVSAIGPLGLHYIHSSDDPRNASPTPGAKPEVGQGPAL